MVKQYKAAEFKAKCLSILDDVAREQEAVYVTKRGKLVAAVVPPPAKQRELAESLRGSIVFEHDLLSPIEDNWDAEK